MSIFSFNANLLVTCVCSSLFLYLMIKSYDAPLFMIQVLHWMGDATCLVSPVFRRDALALHTPLTCTYSVWYPVASLID